MGVVKQAHSSRQVPWITRAAFAIAPMRKGAPGSRPAVRGWGRRNLSAGCGGALHPQSAIIFNEAHAAVPAGRGKCVAIVPHATLVALVAALSTIKVSFYDRKHDFTYNVKASVLSKIFLFNV
jgi:hypothetical protein